MTCVGEANRSLAAYLDELGVDAETRSTAQLVLEEIVTNVIKFGYDDDLTHEILLEVHPEPAGLLLRVEDDGREFNPLLAPPPDLGQPIERRAAGGLGIRLIRRLAARHEYERLEGRNVLRLHLTDSPPKDDDRRSTCP
jgi:serine/threonine-protein kinase RsbW